MKYFLTLISLFFTLFCYAQGQTKTAQELFNEGNYLGAVAEYQKALESGDRSILSAGGFALKKKIDQSTLWTVRDLRNARHYLLELRELLVSCGLPEELLLETKLLQAIGLKRPRT